METNEHDFKELLGSPAAYDKLMGFIFKGRESGTAFSGQTYEDGLLAIIDLLEGNQTVLDTIGA